MGNLLVVAAAICFFLAAINVDLGSVSLVAAGLFLWALSTLVGGGVVFGTKK